MPIITLPDGSQRQYNNSISIQQIAESIGAGLAKAALAGKVDDRLVDLSYILESDAKISIITERDPEGLEVIRHSTAHLVAQAVKQLFPSAQVTIGPVIEDGFYYDFAFERAFTPEDLRLIEERMQEIVSQNLPVSRQTMSRDEAIQLFRSMDEEYKAQIITDIPKDEVLSLYKQGDFIDLCRGPHVPSTGKLGAFKLTKVAGAYWRGDSNNAMLQRIYGTAWPNRKALQEYLTRLEEAEKRDHRKIGKALDLFHFQEEAPGMVFWHAKGWTIYQQLEKLIRQTIAHDYQEIRTPQVVARTLWEKSGHWDKFSHEMFTTFSEERDYAIKPMSCPCHVQVFNQGLRSYRELPLRLAEFGCCHRNELSGALHGLMRVRSMTQDDGHIFCTEQQVQDECSCFIDSLFKVYKELGFEDVTIKLATRPAQRIGSDENWDLAEKSLANALDYKGLSWQEAPGDGAFYGPKIEFSLRDCLGRVWQCGTLQVDFSMPGRLGAEYVAEDGSRKTPVMLHRAILGSLERFIGILLEHHAGFLPLWLSPVQAVVMNITDHQANYVNEIVEILKKHDIRAQSDLRNEKIGFKIREHTLQRIPYQLIIGERELEAKQVAIRTRAGKDLGSMNIDSLLTLLQTEINSKVS